MKAQVKNARFIKITEITSKKSGNEFHLVTIANDDYEVLTLLADRNIITHLRQLQKAQEVHAEIEISEGRGEQRLNATLVNIIAV